MEIGGRINTRRADLQWFTVNWDLVGLGLATLVKADDGLFLPVAELALANLNPIGRLLRGQHSQDVRLDDAPAEAGLEAEEAVEGVVGGFARRDGPHVVDPALAQAGLADRLPVKGVGAHVIALERR